MEAEELIMLETIVTEENLLQKRVISHCKQEMISSVLIGSFIAIVGSGALIWAGTISESEDGLKLLLNFLGLGFLSISSLFFLRTLIRWILLRAARAKKLTMLIWTVGAAAVLDLVIMLISLAVILWTGEFKWLILLIFSLIVDIWRLKSLIQFVIQCRKNLSVV